MNIITLDNYILMSARAADLVMEMINSKPDCVLALPTGRTPLGMYEELVEEFKQGELSFKQVKTFNLDDYVKVPKNHPASFHNYMKKNLFEHVDFKKENIFMLDGTARDLVWECDDYERSVKEVGGIDLAILGIGLNGHIAYNEPGTEFDSETHVVELAESSKKSITKDFDDNKIPAKAITIGIGTIMSSRHIILLASGKNKKEIIKKALHNPITEDIPASVLQKHSNLTVILDKEASV
ncbi:MAG: glucosamine-6-phosphate deaminase [bacterium]